MTRHSRNKEQDDGERNMRTLLAFLGIIVLSLNTAVAAGNADVQAAIDTAKAVHKKAHSLQGGWVTTDKLIKKAEKASAGGQYEKALKLAKQAQIEAELAYAQAEHELKHWSPPPYLLSK